MKTVEKRLENQNKHQRRIIFNKCDDDTPFQWNGNIKSVVYRKYELAGYDGIKAIWKESVRSELRFNENCNIVECVRYREGKQCSKRLQEHSNSGELIVSRVFDETGSQVSESKYRYLANGNLIELSVDTPDRQNKYVYIYDTQGRLVQKVSYKDEVLYKGTSYLYDEIGRIATYAELYPDGGIGLIMSYTYFKNGNLKSSLYNYYDERTFTHYKYDSEGRTIKTEALMYSVGTQHNTSTKLVEEWEYDEKGNVIGLTVSNGEQILYYCEWNIKYRE